MTISSKLLLSERPVAELQGAYDPSPPRGTLTRTRRRSEQSECSDVTKESVFDCAGYLRHTDVVKTAALSLHENQPVDTPAEAVDARTRDRVTKLLIELGPTTAAELSKRLGFTSAGIRRHLDAMISDGVISARSPRPSQVQRGRGRPARNYVLTAAGHAAGPAAYDELAVSALGFLAEHGGEEAIAAFARQRAAELAQRVSARLAPSSVADASELASALTAEGYAATVHPVATGTQLCQHHCPVQAVAAQFPQLCEAETAALSVLLDTHVQRLATIAHGDGVCTTHVPASHKEAAKSSTPAQSSAPADSSDSRKVSP
jgi:predicted ArsR family transcriptional regulator